MSLILEALRKSEAERRRGLPPDLHAELPPATAHRAGTLPAWAWGVAVVALCALGLWLLRREPAMAPLPARAQAPSATVARAASAPAPAQAAVDTALPARTPEPAPPVTPAQSVVVPTPSPAPPAATDASGARPKPSVATPASDLPASPTAAAPPAAPAADPGRVLAIGELDPGTRAALPPLKLTMHLWNDDPARRAVVLDGQRLAEGDHIGGASVVRIERDGVLLEWQGRGIRLPVR